jgi:hypothetical protein
LFTGHSRRRSRSIAALAFGLALAAAPRAVFAAPRHESAALSWVRAKGAEACPGTMEMARKVERRLGRAALVPPARADLVVEAYVEAWSGGGFHVAIALMRDAAVIGRREIENAEASCNDLAEQAALAIALMIDPDAPLSPAKVSEPPPPEPALEAGLTTPTRALPPPPVPRPGARTTEPWQGDLEAAFGMVAGILPGLAPGVVARGRALPPGFPVVLELEGAFFPEQRVEAEPGKGGDFALFVAGLAACSRAPRGARLAASGCGGFEVGSMMGRGYNFDHSPKFQSWVFLLSARARLWFRPAPGLALLLGPNLLVPLEPDEFVTTSQGETTELFRMSPIGLGFELGAVWEF